MIMSKSLSGSSARFAAAVILIIGLRLWAERTLVDIIVGQGVKAELQSKLDRLAADLENDGYTARITSWPAGRGAEDVWNHLKDGYDNDNLHGTLLIGHVPVPGGGKSDLPYWNMYSYSSNRPGHIWVSRMYAPPASTYGDEVSLLGNALDANHAYRTGESRLSHKAWTYSCTETRGYCQGAAAGREWAKTALGTWPESEAVDRDGLAEAMYELGGDILEESSHGLKNSYAKGTITTPKLHRMGCRIRVVLATSCHAGTLGGVVNAQNIADGTCNVIGVGATNTIYQPGYRLMRSSGSICRALLRAGEPWGKALLGDYPFSYLTNRKTIMYGDLSLPPLMYPSEEGLPGKAGIPRPGYKEHIVDLTTPLQWVSRGGTTSHDVYLGTDSRPGSGDFRGNQTANTYDAGGLEPGETYFWRIDEKNAHGTTRGSVWYFTTDDGLEKRLFVGQDTARSTDESRMGGTIFAVEKPIRITEILVDNLLLGSKDNVAIWRYKEPGEPLHVFSIETGQTKSEVSHPVDLILPEGMYVIAGLFKEYHRTWIWDLTIPRGIERFYGVCESDVSSLQYPTDVSDVHLFGQVNVRFSFVGAPSVAPGRATNPSPADGATEVPVDADLTWTSGSGAGSHTVYFGTDSLFEADEEQGSRTAAVFVPEALRAHTTYYWRIDEVNEHGVTEGEVWRFTTRNDVVGCAPALSTVSAGPVLSCSNNTIRMDAGSQTGVAALVTVMDPRGAAVMSRRIKRIPAVWRAPLPEHARGAYIVRVRIGDRVLCRAITVVEDMR